MRELNWKPGQSAELALLGSGGAAPVEAHILEVAGKCVRVAAKLSVKSDAAVRLEWDGQLLLGRVLRVEPGGFRMEIEHMLPVAGEPDWQKQGWQRG